MAALAVVGPHAVQRMDARGLHRNAWAALVLTHWAYRSSAHVAAAPTAAPLPFQGAMQALGSWRGLGAGGNIIWVILESTGASYLRAYGAERDATPRLTALAHEGVVFDNVFAAYPESIKGLYSILCAWSPAPNTNAEQYASAALRGRCVPEQLAAAGYRTGLFHSGRFAYLGMTSVIANRGFHELEDAGHIGGRFRSSFGTDDASTASRVLQFIDRRDERPFFALYMPIAGHHPYRSPGEASRPFEDRSEQDSYLNDLYGGDEALGMLIDGVRARGLQNAVTWVIMGDHGEAFGQHEGNFAHSLHVYDENVHVPLIIVTPNAPTKGTRAPQVGSLIDVGPTLLDLVGVPPLSEAEGRSLLGVPPAAARFFTDYAVQEAGLRHGPWKFLYEVETARSRLFDIERDPLEQNNIADRQPELVALYERDMRAWLQATRARVLAHGAPVAPR